MWELFKYIRNIEIAKDSVKKNKVKKIEGKLKKQMFNQNFKPN